MIDKAYENTFGTHQLEELDKVVAVEGHENLEGKPDFVRVPDPLLQGHDCPQRVAVVQIHKNLKKKGIETVQHGSGKKKK